MSSVSVRTSNVRFPAAKNLYGIFFEDINRSGDGGLYPEMLRNRSFEDSILPERCTLLPNGLDFSTPNGWKDQFNNGEGLRRWDPDRADTPVPAWYTRDARICLDYKDVLNDSRRSSLLVRFSAGGALFNTGFRGIPAEKGVSCTGYLFLKAENPCRLTVSLSSADLKRNYASAVLDVAGHSPDRACEEEKNNCYIKYDFTLTPDETDWDARFVIRAAEETELRIGYASLLPSETFQGHGLRKDLAELLRAASPRFLRFPGGCIVEGFTKETAMRFPSTIGPVWERPSHNLMWHYRTSNGLGFHEFLQLCEDLDLEPLYVINCGLTCQARREELFEEEELDTLLQEACDAIDYATAPADTLMGSLRAKAGHPEPFKMTYIEIGNENLGPEYLERYSLFYDTLKSRYPQLKYIANIHVEEEQLLTDIVDEHYYNTPEFFARQYHMFDKYDRRGPEIFVGEYAVTSGDDVGNLRSAIAESMFLLGIENNQDIVTMTAYAPLFSHVHYTSWAPDLIVFDNHRSYGIPFYHALSLLAANRGSEIVETDTVAPISYEKSIGLTGLVSDGPGVSIRNMTCNGIPVAPSHNIVSSLEEENRIYRTTASDNEELLRSPGLAVDEVLQDVKTYVTFGETETGPTVFEAELYLEDPSVKTSIAFWIHNNTMLFNQDETRSGESKLWTPVYTNRYVWSLWNGTGYIDSINRSRYTWRGPHVTIPELVYGRWMKIRVDARWDRIRCYIDDRLVLRQPTLGYPIAAASAALENDTILIKLANIQETPEPVRISLDCSVADEYEAVVLTGDSPKTENSFEHPLAVSPAAKKMRGASPEFTYQAPACSLSILKLQKRRQ